MRASRRVWLGRLALAGPIAFTIAWLVGGLVQGEYSPRQEDISALADAQHADHDHRLRAARRGNSCLGGGSLASTQVPICSDRFNPPRHRRYLSHGGRVGRRHRHAELALLGRRRSGERVARSWHHEVHDNVSLIIFLALIAAPLVLARAFGRDDRWRPLRAYSIVTGLLGSALLVLYVIEPAPAWNGLVQRIFVSVLFLWIAVLGLRLARAAPSPLGRIEAGPSRVSSSAGGTYQLLKCLPDSCWYKRRFRQLGLEPTRRAARAPSAVIQRSVVTATHEMPRSRKRLARSGVPAKPPTTRPYAAAVSTIRAKGLPSESSSSSACTVVPRESERSYGPTNS